MGKKIFMDALLLSASTDMARGCLCGVSVDAIGPDYEWIRFVCTDGGTLQAVKVNNRHEAEYNLWAFENRLPKWTALRKKMVLIPWDRLRKLHMTETYQNPARFGKDNPYPDWMKLVRTDELVDDTSNRGWFGSDVTSVLSTAKKVYLDTDKVEWIARAWKGQAGIHLDCFDTGSICGILLGMPLRVISETDDPEGSVSSLKSVYANLISEPNQKIAKAA